MGWVGGPADPLPGRNGERARGFGFSVWLDGAVPRDALANPPEELGTAPDALAAAMRALVTRMVPDAQVHVSPASADPAAPPDSTGPGEAAILIDVGRQLLLIEGRPVLLSYREFKLLCYLVLHPGVTVGRGELIDAQRTWSRVANPRTIDVHIQRLRVKLGGYGDILRTERGIGYRYDAHPDVRVRG